MKMKRLPQRGRSTTAMDVLCASQCTPEASRAEIGRRCGVSRERVRQILGNSGRRDVRKTPRSPRIQLFCEFCGKPYARTVRQVACAHAQGTRPRFCSRSCRTRSYLESHIVRRWITCLRCGKRFRLSDSVYQQRLAAGGPKFCLMACYSAHRRLTKRGA